MVRRDPSASQQQRGGGQLMKQNQQQSPEKTEKKPETTGAVRLDINLEVEVHIKARLHGDLTIAIEMWKTKPILLYYILLPSSSMGEINL